MKHRVINLALFILALCLSSLMGFTALSAEESDLLIRQEAQRGGYRLIDVDTLWELYQGKADSILLVDTRQDWEYRSGSIKGARHFSMEPTWFSRLIERNALAQLLGPDKDRILIFY
jgi:hypothetical protein